MYFGRRSTRFPAKQCALRCHNHVPIVRTKKDCIQGTTKVK